MATRKEVKDPFVMDTIRARECHMTYGQYKAYKYTHHNNKPDIERVPEYLRGGSANDHSSATDNYQIASGDSDIDALMVRTTSDITPDIEREIERICE